MTIGARNKNMPGAWGGPPLPWFAKLKMALGTRAWPLEARQIIFEIDTSRRQARP